MPFAVALLAVMLLLGAGANVRRSLGPVSRERLSRFAERQRQTITAGNGNLVIAYLATTRRWRATGLLVSLLAGVVVGVRTGRLSVGALPLLSGWFAGAVVAEWRVGRPPAGERRAASLVPRVATAYLPRSARALPLVTAGLSLVVLLVALSLNHRPRALPLRSLALSAAMAVVLAAAARVVERRVVDRSQPLTEPDVLAADDAIRSRSLHVVVGATATLALFCVSSQLSALADAVTDTPDAARLRTLAVVTAFGGLLVGRMAALSPWAVRRHLAAAATQP
ncbi:MAG: hypothetical protein QOI42_1835 [Frankiaceae bacterium]|jgi:hypothetical protein|nr:hypothetical protein [Frankiaceae bacterium]